MSIDKDKLIQELKKERNDYHKKFCQERQININGKANNLIQQRLKTAKEIIDLYENVLNDIASNILSGDRRSAYRVLDKAKPLKEKI